MTAKPKTVPAPEASPDGTTPDATETGTAPPPEVDPFAGMTVYAAEAFIPPAPAFPESVRLLLGDLVTSGKRTLDVHDWAPGVQSTFIRTLKKARPHLVGGDRKLYFKNGTLTGQDGSVRQALQVTLTIPAAKAEATPPAA